MVEAEEKKTTSDFAKVPIIWPVLIAIVMFGAAEPPSGVVAKLPAVKLPNNN
jgi:hypothetical protein